MKYIFISGGVISGIGKGITTASLALLLKSSGYKVAPIKFENYLNLDAGTINPIEHGDVFLCEDGTEADMDIGTYEKFLDEDMGKDNFVTMGRIYKTVIDKERRFEYQGKDVSAIPFVTNEIIERIEHLGKTKQADIVLIELGGTVGEYQNVFYYESARQLALKKPGDVVHIHVSYVPTPSHLGEPKTKPTQLSVMILNSMGIQPDFIIARGEKPLDARRIDKFALYCNVKPENIISNPNVYHPYEVPLILNKQKLAEKVLKELNLEVRSPDITKWKKLVNKIHKKKDKTIQIAIVGKYFDSGDYELKDAYSSLFDALDHASWKLNISIDFRLISAEKVEKKGVSIIGNPDGIIVPIGWGERGAEGMIKTASYARVNKIPYLGLCYGMQLAVVAFARDVLGWPLANTTENDPKTEYDVVHLMPKQRKYMQKRAYGGTMRLGAWQAKIKRNTLAYKIYKKTIISERHRHRYEFNDKFAKEFEKAGLVISARSTVENLCEIIELNQKDHPFYFAVQGHPEYKSRPLNPHPVFVRFLKEALKNSFA
ncbi:MAG: CTP synthetase [Patescibacteria group bacterium]|nr:MAG: CTP synthetase [Patescibacteria group bacterium]